MSYTGQNPRFRSTILADIGLASIGNPASGSHRIINRGGTLQVQDSTGLETAIGAGGTVDRITQVGHGFVEGEILYNTGSAYAKANANAAATAEALGMVSRVIDVDTFELTLEGKVTGLTGLTAGAVYFLSGSTAGAITVTEPSTLGYVSLPIGVAISTTAFYVKSSRGAVVGSTNARTEIALADNATTNVQSVAAYQAGELTGWVEIDGTTDLKFYVAAPFAKNGAATDFNISPQYVGDTPPVGFSLSVTSGGIIQATLPSIAGYVSAKINYALNAPAVGATFPLSIDSTIVQFSTLKAKDSSGFIFQENGGTQIGSISDNSDWVFGKSAGGNAHTMYGRDGNPTGFQHTLNIRASSAANSIFLNLGTYETGDYAWIQSLESDTGNPKPFKFWTGNIEAGGYGIDAAWSFGTYSTTGNHKFYGNDVNIRLDALTGSSASIYFQENAANKWLIQNNPSLDKFEWYAGASTIVGSISQNGEWEIGRSTTTGAHSITNSNGSGSTLYVNNQSATNGTIAVRSFVNNSGNASWPLYCESGLGVIFGARADGLISMPNLASAAGTTLVRNVNGFVYLDSSSIRYKKNILDIDLGLNFVNTLRPVKFDLISTDEAQVGFIAEEVDVLDQRLVSHSRVDPNDPNSELQVESVHYTKMVAVLTKAIQELSAKVTALENKGI